MATRSPSRPRRPGPAGAPPAPRTAFLPRALDEAEIGRLQSLLDAVPAPLEPLDASALDGYLCGFLVQPRPVAEGAWWPRVIDIDGRPAPRSFEPGPLRALIGRRRAELADAIARRRWFDPWIFAAALPDETAIEGGAEADAVAGGVDAGHDDDDAHDAHDDDDDDDDDDAMSASIEAVEPWVAGFTLALEAFPRLLEGGGPAIDEPLAMLYRHVGTDHLEDAQAVCELIEALEPPADLAGAIEELVRATLLLADAAAAMARGR